MCRHHHAHVDDVVVVALQDHGDDVFSNVVHIAFDGGHDDLAFGFDVFTGSSLLALFFLDIGNKVGHGLLHHASAFDHLRQEHFALPEQVPHDVHAVHQGAFDHMQRATTFGQNLAVGLFGVESDELGDAVHQCVAQPLCHGNRLLSRAAPVVATAFILGCALGAFGGFDQTLTWRQR